MECLLNKKRYVFENRTERIDEELEVLKEDKKTGFPIHVVKKSTSWTYQNMNNNDW